MTDRHRAVLGRVVEALRATPSLSVIATFGSTATESWTEHSDLDLIAFFEADPPVDALHLSVDGVLIDLGLRWSAAPPDDPHGSFWDTLTPLWDPDDDHSRAE